MRHNESLWRGGRPTLTACLLVATALALGGCADSHLEASLTPGGASSVAATRAPSVPGATKASSPSLAAGTASRPANPLAGKYVPVMRNGKRPKPTISAKAAPFNKTVRYSDGLTLQIKKIIQGAETQYGRGAFHGSPTTQLAVTMTNNTKKTVNIEQVIVQMVYGSPSRVAPPVDDNAASDFSGMLVPGHSQTATYIFSVPTSQLGNVTMTVDLDSVHVAATFLGSVKN